MGTARICVVGAGRWGQNHLRALREMGCLAGVVEVEPNQKRKVEEEYNVDVYSCVEQALKVGFDGYVVAVPAILHKEVALPLLASGCSVLIEKPMALTLAEANELLGVAKRHGANVMVGHLLLFHPAIRKVKELIDNGELGRLMYLYSNRLNFGRVRTEENAFWSLAPHDISLFNYFLNAAPKSVAAQGGAFLRAGVEDEVRATLYYANGVRGSIFTSWLHPFKEHRLVIVGDKGMVVYEDSSEQKEVLLYRKSFLVNGLQTDSYDEGVEVVPYEHRLPLTEELRYFIEQRKQGYAIASGQEGAEVVRVLEEVSEALRECK